MTDRRRADGTPIRGGLVALSLVLHGLFSPCASQIYGQERLQQEQLRDDSTFSEGTAEYPIEEDSTAKVQIVKSFQEFLNDPPIIAEIIAQVCNYTQREATGADESRCYFVLLRYQTNAFFYREAPQLMDLTTSNYLPGFQMGGHYEDEYWTFTLDGRTLNTATNRHSSTYKAVEHVLAKASPILNLGISGALPQSTRWAGNVLEPLTNHYGVSFSGRLTVSNLFPRHLLLTTDYQGYIVPWEIEYEFASSTSRPSFLPAMISCWALRDDVRTLFCEVHLITAAIQTEPLPKQFFMPDGFNQKVFYEVLSTQDGLYYRDKYREEFRPLSSGFGDWRLTVVVFVLLNLVMLSALFIYIWRRSRFRK